MTCCNECRANKDYADRPCNDLGCKCHYATYSWRDEFQKQLQELNESVPEHGHDGDIKEFGYKAYDCCGDFIYTVPDWGNIEKWIAYEMNIQKKELIEKIREKAPVYFVNGIPPDRDYTSFMDGWLSCRAEFMNSINDIP